MAGVFLDLSFKRLQNLSGQQCHFYNDNAKSLLDFVVFLFKPKWTSIPTGVQIVNSGCLGHC